jgi:hypothetical protein
MDLLDMDDCFNGPLKNSQDVTPNTQTEPCLN